MIGEILSDRKDKTVKKLVICLIFICVLLTGCESKQLITSSLFIPDFNDYDISYEVSDIAAADKENIANNMFLYEDICFEEEDISNGLELNLVAEAAGCYNITDREVIYTKNVYARMYPASTTKLLTCLTATKYGDLDKVYEISEDNCGITIKGAQLCGFMKGDRLSLRQLLYCLMIHSGNDAAVAIANCVSGDAKSFVELMNKEAKAIGAIGTHMTNPHGLHDPNHYSTPYDIYLILNECFKHEFLVELISQRHYVCEFKDINGNPKTLEMEATNLYFSGKKTPPENITVLGGKTGVTSAAGYCLIIASRNEEGKIFITEVFKSDSYDHLYSDMNELLYISK